MPEPVWSDGMACVYAGQKVGWQTEFGGRTTYFYATVIGVDDSPYPAGGIDLVVRLDDGRGAAQISPYLIG